ncbi:hypothetical protein [Fusobacterium necrogenes]|uniref:hypothetical protein n=1 Tax=Fusobacterium necrogenes TaxID=858 RepID=UPI0038B3BB13
MTEFNLRGTKIYLSLILDTCRKYIVSYNISSSSNSNQIIDMLDKVFSSNKKIEKLTFHSD